MTKGQAPRALDVRDMNVLMSDLSQHKGVFGGFWISRSELANDQICGATWSEIDFWKRIWTIPGDRMKAKNEHLVSLSGAAIILLKRIQRGAQADFIFPRQGGKQLSDASM